VCHRTSLGFIGGPTSYIESTGECPVILDLRTKGKAMTEINTIPADRLWLGISASTQEELDAVVPALLAMPAAKRFLSLEPLLGPIDFLRAATNVGIDWVIVGGESGPNARPMHPDWVRSIRDQCQAAGVPFFFKQWGEWLPAQSDDGEPFIDINGVMRAIPSDDDPSAQWPDPCVHVWRSGRVPNSDDGYFCDASIRVGKKAAGRLLDGRTWDETPETSPWHGHANSAT
jgi:protein gp37